MIFKNQSDAINQLIVKLKDESLPVDAQITALTSEGEIFAKAIASAFNVKYFFLPNFMLNLQSPIHNPRSIIVVDDGQLRVGEYPEFIDHLRSQSPSTEIIICTPVIPQSEEAQFKKFTDRLITLWIEPLFFNMTQFYDVSSQHQ